MDLTTQRSQTQAINKEIDIYLADTIGEMTFLQLVISLLLVGLSPQRRAKSSGSCKAGYSYFLRAINQNFSEMFSLIREVDVSWEIITQDDMTDMVDLLLSDPTLEKNSNQCPSID